MDYRFSKPNRQSKIDKARERRQRPVTDRFYNVLLNVPMRPESKRVKRAMEG